MKFDKMVSEIVSFSQYIFTTPLTKEDVIERYETSRAEYGEEAAQEAIKNTYNQFKKQAKEEEKKHWNKVKSEIFKKNGYVPTSVRDLKNYIKEGKINISGIESEQWIKKTLNLTA